jgi:23S rRNA G2445 N2-methylase RlmL
LPVESAEQLANWDPYDQNGVSPFFDPEWMFDVKNGFDVVIGNPPYFIVYNKKIKKTFETLYPVFKRNNDIYIAFYNNGKLLLKDNGNLCYITPNTFLNGDYFKNFREYLTSHVIIEEIFDFKNHKIFKEQTVFTSILRFKNSKKTNNYQIPLKTYLSNINSFTIEKLPITINSKNSFKVANPIIKLIQNQTNIEIISKFR